MTVCSLDLVSTNLDNSNDPKSIYIGQSEVEIFIILIFGSRSIDLYRKNMFFHFSSDVATNSVRYVKFINLHQETMILGAFCTSYPQNNFFLDSQKKRFSSIDISVKYVILYKAQDERQIIIGN